MSFDIAHPGLKQFQHALIAIHPHAAGPARSEAAEDGEQTQIHLGVGQIDAQTLPGALGETEQEAIQAGVFDPALGPEGERVGEDGWVLLDVHARHADGDSGRDDPFFLRPLVAVDHGFVRADPLEPRGHAVAEPDGLLNHRDQVRAVF